jgi:branched-chain amino acid transport system substrate-binding protein
VIQSGAQIVLLGTVYEDAVAFVQLFRQQHFNPQAVIATAGPDQGATWLKDIGGANVSEGILVPNSWFPTADTYQNAKMVQEYIAKYGGTADEVSGDVAQAYSVGQVLQQAVENIKSIDNAKLIAELHSGNTYKSVQGDVKFDDIGENIVALAYLFQWQGGKFIPVLPPNSPGGANIEYPKPPWP